MVVKDTPPWRLDPFQRITDFHFKKKSDHHTTGGGGGGGHYIWTVANWTAVPNVFQYTGSIGIDADFSAATEAAGHDLVAYWASVGVSALYIGTMSQVEPDPTPRFLWQEGLVLSGGEINPSTGIAWWPHGMIYTYIYAGLKVNV
jgi:hypothetical protein